jgi:hypothetical protein
LKDKSVDKLTQVLQSAKEIFRFQTPKATAHSSPAWVHGGVGGVGGELLVPGMRSEYCSVIITVCDSRAIRVQGRKRLRVLGQTSMPLKDAALPPSTSSGGASLKGQLDSGGTYELILGEYKVKLPGMIEAQTRAASSTMARMSTGVKRLTEGFRASFQGKLHRRKTSYLRPITSTEQRDMDRFGKHIEKGDKKMVEISVRPFPPQQAMCGFLLQRTQSRFCCAPSKWEKRWAVLQGEQLFLYPSYGATRYSSSLDLGSASFVGWAEGGVGHEEAIEISKHDSTELVHFDTLPADVGMKDEWFRKINLAAKALSQQRAGAFLMQVSCAFIFTLGIFLADSFLIVSVGLVQRNFCDALPNVQSRVSLDFAAA